MTAKPVYRVIRKYEQREHGASPFTIYSPTPDMLRTAYGTNTTTALGTGQTIAIVNAYGDLPANILSNMVTFNTEFGLPATSMTIHIMPGAIIDPLWEAEIALDTQWVHAIAPSANILLVLATSSLMSDLFAAVTYAISNGATIVSMSFGTSEYPGEILDDATFVPVNNLGQNVTYFAATGDLGGLVNYPSISPFVVGVGGTDLTMNLSGTRLAETGASLSGGGVSLYEPKPSFQNLYGLAGAFRQAPDVSCIGDNPGVPVFYGGIWNQVTGTSLSCPVFAAMCGIVNELRGIISKQSLTVNSCLTYLYGTRANQNVRTGIVTNGNPIVSSAVVSLGSVVFPGQYNTDFFDIIVGTAGSFTCVPGYDNVTGLGTPNNLTYINGIIADLVAL